MVRGDIKGGSPKKLGNLQSDTNRVKRHSGDSDYEKKIQRRTDYQASRAA